MDLETVSQLPLHLLPGKGKLFKNLLTQSNAIYFPVSMVPIVDQAPRIRNQTSP